MHTPESTSCEVPNCDVHGGTQATRPTPDKSDDLRDLFKALFLEHPEGANYLGDMVREMRSFGLHEVPRYTSLVAALEAATEPQE
jgi:hypothetical protein